MTNTERRRQAAREPLDHHPARLRRRRIANGMSLSQLAEVTSASKGHLSELERGTRNPSPELLAAIARALGCGVTDLMPDEPVTAGAR
ncbi:MULTISPECIES: helix-turn-helix domain-containing protein [Catenuloplanes]|uniref:Transcriptional regulator with XRE-family HTH domain n=1 Tax=Catenuloplanes niger TaxID=587534 RepID=A0AAE4CRW1_9ACTN|nr:helix-turn-helix transcriptional regulator [Catenuloplanes niger]MDR7323411.1 transcriptional regulator with XRE-family HTH domain [Catenuloplanes niger]